MWPVDDRTLTAIGQPHGIRTRLEVWRGDEQVGEVTGSDIIDGSVTDKWVTTGPRRTLSVEVPATREWLEWLRIGVELRPYQGVVFGGPNPVVMAPHGCFPVLRFPRARRAETLKVQATDRWQWLTAATIRPLPAYSLSAVESVSALIVEIDPFLLAGKVVATATSTARTPAVLWDKSRSDTITELVKSVGAEAWFGREGFPVIQDRPTPSAPVVAFRAGRGGTLSALALDVDYSTVINAVVVTSSATNTTLAPVWVAISDPFDPAHRSKIRGGARSGGWRSVRYASPLFTTVEQMIKAGETLLRKGAAPARSWALTAVPNPYLDASDTATVQNQDGGVELVQIDQVSHPLTAKGQQQITTVSTRPADAEEV